MPWFKFDADFDHKIGPRHFVAYKAGMVKMVPTDCAEAATKAGAGHRTTKPMDAPKADKGVTEAQDTAEQKDDGTGDGDAGS